ncbi:MAG: putrescine aminotransferase [Coriobacteriales bacterium]|jgi:putrescine aminotransferase|nr:putrescine aminotransferase [Coriobacteriales bacterium]
MNSITTRDGITYDVAKASELLDEALGFIASDHLDDDQKQQIIEQSVQNFNEYVNPGFIPYRKSMSTNVKYIEWTDSDSHIFDLYGEEFIDCLGGFGIYNFGHRNPKILSYVQKQLERQALHSQELLDPLRGYLAQVVARITPGDLRYCFFTNGGAEAVEMALKLARIASGKRHIISSIGGFHGKSSGALSVGGKALYRIPYLPLVQEVSHVRYGDIDDLRLMIERLTAVGEQIAAVIIEPVQGEAGIIVPPAGYLQQVRELCDSNDILLIFDEIQTGMGRTGSYFRCLEENVTPDIMTYGKAFGGGIMPITGIIARPHLWVEPLIDNPWLLGSPTFGGNPLACAAALGAIDFMIREDASGMARSKGAFLLDAFKGFMEKYPNAITDVRGVGLMIGVEFAAPELGYAFARGMFSRKVLTSGTLNNARIIRFEPPLTISQHDLDAVLERMDAALAEL